MCRTGAAVTELLTQQSCVAGHGCYEGKAGTVAVASRWDNIEILQAIDRVQRETYRGGPIRSMNGFYLMEQIEGPGLTRS